VQPRAVVPKLPELARNLLERTSTMIRLPAWAVVSAGALALLMVASQRATGDWAQPVTPWRCPADSPIKGNLTTYSGEYCIYHVPGGQFYARTKPERCYATEPDAQADGCRRSKR
jgi:hypothetical protein